MVCEGHLKWGAANAIGVALVDLRMQSSTPAVVPGAALPRPRLGRVGGYDIVYYTDAFVTSNCWRVFVRIDTVLNIQHLRYQSVTT